MTPFVAPIVVALLVGIPALVATVLLTGKANAARVWEDAASGWKEQAQLYEQRAATTLAENASLIARVDRLGVEVRELKQRDQGAVLEKLDRVVDAVTVGMNALGDGLDRHELGAQERAEAYRLDLSTIKARQAEIVDVVARVASALTEEHPA